MKFLVPIALASNGLFVPTTRKCDDHDLGRHIDPDRQDAGPDAAGYVEQLVINRDLAIGVLRAGSDDVITIRARIIQK